MTVLIAFFPFSTNHHRRAIASFVDVLPSSHFNVLGIYNEKTNVVDNTQIIQSIARNNQSDSRQIWLNLVTGTRLLHTMSLALTTL